MQYANVGAAMQDAWWSPRCPTPNKGATLRSAQCVLAFGVAGRRPDQNTPRRLTKVAGRPKAFEASQPGGLGDPVESTRSTRSAHRGVRTSIGVYVRPDNRPDSAPTKVGRAEWSITCFQSNFYTNNQLLLQALHSSPQF